ncbi:ABC transporter permease [Bacillus cereus]|nr:ABC-2 family transporter protein [Bacillus cereus]MDA2079896.1 ABC-2 family transporter protein [Bacillus cereus]MDA2085486.1 ABC-2 family transporter protein [Bacillus cereus]MDA2178588.1 ABC-2 family transporter protein [Bacillus cereus]
MINRWSLQKYLRVSYITWQKGMEYRFSVVYMVLEALIPSIAMIFLWQSIYANGDTLEGYSFSELVMYFIGARLINYFVWYAIDWELHELVHDGKLGTLLIKPIDVQLYYFWEMIGDRIVNFVLGAIPLLVLTMILSIYFNFQLYIYNFLLGIISVILSCILWFLVSWTIGCYVFWTQKADMVLFVKEIVIMCLAGSFFPIDILPSYIVSLIDKTPFPYLAYFPLKVLFTDMGTEHVMTGLITQIVWCTIFFILGRIVWKKGLKKYVDVGG